MTVLCRSREAIKGRDKRRKWIAEERFFRFQRDGAAGILCRLKTQDMRLTHNQRIYLRVARKYALVFMSLYPTTSHRPPFSGPTRPRHPAFFQSGNLLFYGGSTHASTHMCVEVNKHVCWLCIPFVDCMAHLRTHWLHWIAPMPLFAPFIGYNGVGMDMCHCRIHYRGCPLVMPAAPHPRTWPYDSSAHLPSSALRRPDTSKTTGFFQNGNLLFYRSGRQVKGLGDLPCAGCILLF